MTFKISVTQDKIDFILAHINERPRRKIAKLAGVSISTLYRIVRDNGGIIEHYRSVRHPDWWDDYIREHYPDETAVDIAKHLGTIKGRVNKIAHDMGVKHSETFLANVKAEKAKRCRELFMKQDYQEIARKTKHSRLMDERRVLYGLERKTKFKLKTMSQKAYRAKWHIVNKYNYFVDDNNPYNLYFDEETKRVNEEYYFQKYKLTFTDAS